MIALGRWQDVLADVVCDAVICDPPYGARTHAGQVDLDLRRDLTYTHWTPDDVAEFVASWSPRCDGWIAAMTSDDLIPVWRDAYAAAGRFDFAPVPILQDRVRLTGDGPASGAVYLMVARPRSKRFSTWGALPGWYKAGTERNGHIGGKPLQLMRSIVGHYSREGDLVVDPTAGYGTTLIAAHELGRRVIGAEIDPTTHAEGSRRLAAAQAQVRMFAEPLAVQESLLSCK